jgi:hypothetical protein
MAIHSVTYVELRAAIGSLASILIDNVPPHLNQYGVCVAQVELG